MRIRDRDKKKKNTHKRKNQTLGDTAVILWFITPVPATARAVRLRIGTRSQEHETSLQYRWQGPSSSEWSAIGTGIRHQAGVQTLHTPL